MNNKLTAINYVKGDATQPVFGLGRAVIAHICNDAGIWSQGFVRALSKNWDAPERDYRDWHGGMRGDDIVVGGPFRLGEIQLVHLSRFTDGLAVCNMVAQRGIGGKQPLVSYEALEKCLGKLQTFISFMSHGHPTSVHMPRIGCGLGGGDWSAVEPIINDTLIAAGIPVTVYDLP